MTTRIKRPPWRNNFAYPRICTYCSTMRMKTKEDKFTRWVSEYQISYNKKRPSSRKTSSSDVSSWLSSYNPPLKPRLEKDKTVASFGPRGGGPIKITSLKHKGEDKTQHPKGYYSHRHSLQTEYRDQHGDRHYHQQPHYTTHSEPKRQNTFENRDIHGTSYYPQISHHHSDPKRHDKHMTMSHNPQHSHYHSDPKRHQIEYHDKHEPHQNKPMFQPNHLAPNYKYNSPSAVAGPNVLSRAQAEREARIPQSQYISIYRRV
ncbi:hypothetical protein EGW08_015040 [Elysia chlorotica]|uniref:Uncharacterized protein n=1 Tax=Elysia chlorotica TaxID=188477 RepID=A0A433T6M5_ELYCH|nr:hypothetical protein EGW08_015040 [Elysia chlorotica]